MLNFNYKKEIYEEDLNIEYSKVRFGELISDFDKIIAEHRNLGFIAHRKRFLCWDNHVKKFNYYLRRCKLFNRVNILGSFCWRRLVFSFYKLFRFIISVRIKIKFKHFVKYSLRDSRLLFFERVGDNIFDIIHFLLIIISKKHPVGLTVERVDKRDEVAAIYREFFQTMFNTHVCFSYKYKTHQLLFIYKKLYSIYKKYIYFIYRVLCAHKFGLLDEGFYGIIPYDYMLNEYKKIPDSVESNYKKNYVRVLFQPLFIDMTTNNAILMGSEHEGISRGKREGVAKGFNDFSNYALSLLEAFAPAKRFLLEKFNNVDGRDWHVHKVDSPNAYNKTDYAWYHLYSSRDWYFVFLYWNKGFSVLLKDKNIIKFYRAFFIFSRFYFRDSDGPVDPRHEQDLPIDFREGFRTNRVYLLFYYLLKDKNLFFNNYTIYLTPNYFFNKCLKNSSIDYVGHIEFYSRLTKKKFPISSSTLSELGVYHLYYDLSFLSFREICKEIIIEDFDVDFYKKALLDRLNRPDKEVVYVDRAPTPIYPFNYDSDSDSDSDKNV